MKKIAGLIVFLMLAAVAVHAGDQDFTLVNDTGLTIDQLYVSPSAKPDWEEDILGQDVLKNGEKAHITFSRDEKAAEWDIMIVDEEGDKVYWKEIDLLEAETITLYYEDGKPTAKIDTGEDAEEPAEGEKKE
jgi:hypothetical protein